MTLLALAIPIGIGSFMGAVVANPNVRVSAIASFLVGIAFNFIAISAVAFIAAFGHVSGTANTWAMVIALTLAAAVTSFMAVEWMGVEKP